MPQQKQQQQAPKLGERYAPGHHKQGLPAGASLSPWQNGMVIYYDHKSFRVVVETLSKHRFLLTQKPANMTFFRFNTVRFRASSLYGRHRDQDLLLIEEVCHVREPIETHLCPLMTGTVIRLPDTLNRNGAILPDGANKPISYNPRSLDSKSFTPNAVGIKLSFATCTSTRNSTGNAFNTIYRLVLDEAQIDSTRDKVLPPHVCDGFLDGIRAAQIFIGAFDKTWERTHAVPVFGTEDFLKHFSHRERLGKFSLNVLVSNLLPQKYSAENLALSSRLTDLKERLKTNETDTMNPDRDVEHQLLVEQIDEVKARLKLVKVIREDLKFKQQNMPSILINPIPWLKNFDGSQADHSFADWHKWVSDHYAEPSSNHPQVYLLRPVSPYATAANHHLVIGHNALIDTTSAPDSTEEIFYLSSMVHLGKWSPLLGSLDYKGNTTLTKIAVYVLSQGNTNLRAPLDDKAPLVRVTTRSLDNTEESLNFETQSACEARAEGEEQDLSKALFLAQRTQAGGVIQTTSEVNAILRKLRQQGCDTTQIMVSPEGHRSWLIKAPSDSLLRTITNHFTGHHAFYIVPAHYLIHPTINQPHPPPPSNPHPPPPLPRPREWTHSPSNPKTPPSRRGKMRLRRM